MREKLTFGVLAVLFILAAAAMIQITTKEQTSGLMMYGYSEKIERCWAPYPDKFAKRELEQIPNFYDLCVYAFTEDGSVSKEWMCCNDKLAKERRPPVSPVRPMSGMGQYY